MYNKTISTREQAAIRLYILDGERIPREQLFRIAYDGSEEDIGRLASTPSLATRWFQSGRIQEYYNEQKTLEADRRERERAAIKADIVAQMKNDTAAVANSETPDYTDPRQAVAKLNSIIFSAKDSSEALDGLKVLLQRQQELAAASATNKPEAKQMRFFVPLQCHDCPLYKEKHKSINNK